MSVQRLQNVCYLLEAKNAGTHVAWKLKDRVHIERRDWATISTTTKKTVMCDNLADNKKTPVRVGNVKRKLPRVLLLLRLLSYVRIKLVSKSEEPVYSAVFQSCSGSSN